MPATIIADGSADGLGQIVDVVQQIDNITAL
jgi:hypothetical protein